MCCSSRCSIYTHDSLIIGILNSEEKGATCDGRSCYSVYISPVLADREVTLTRVYTNNLILEPLASLSTETWSLRMLKKGVTKDITFGIKTDKHLERSTETILYSHNSLAELFTSIITDVIDSEAV